MSLFCFRFLFCQYNEGTIYFRLAAEKDSELARASIAMGLLLFSRGLLMEASKHFEHAISKVLISQLSFSLLLIVEVDLVLEFRPRTVVLIFFL